MSISIEEMVKSVSNVDRVAPGLPASFTEAACAGDFGWQGDLKLTVLDKVPASQKKVAKPSDLDRQLVPGNTEGAKHCLDSLDGVALYRPSEWSEESLIGPTLKLTKDRVIMHPTHGHVTVLAGTIIGCTYQREFDAELRRETRARD